MSTLKIVEYNYELILHYGPLFCFYCFRTYLHFQENDELKKLLKNKESELMKSKY